VSAPGLHMLCRSGDRAKAGRYGEISVVPEPQKSLQGGLAKARRGFDRGPKVGGPLHQQALGSAMQMVDIGKLLRYYQVRVRPPDGEEAHDAG
jgi:hypothetical protein